MRPRPDTLSLANCPVSCFLKQQKTTFSEGRRSLLFWCLSCRHPRPFICLFVHSYSYNKKSLSDRYTCLHHPFGIQLCLLLFFVWKGQDTDGSGWTWTWTWTWMDGWMRGWVGGYKNTLTHSHHEPWICSSHSSPLLPPPFRPSFLPFLPSFWSPLCLCLCLLLCSGLSSALFLPLFVPYSWILYSFFFSFFVSQTRSAPEPVGLCFCHLCCLLR